MSSIHCPASPLCDGDHVAPPFVERPRSGVPTEREPPASNVESVTKRGDEMIAMVGITPN